MSCVKGFRKQETIWIFIAKNLCMLQMIGIARKLICCNALGFLVCTVIVITRQFPLPGRIG